MRVSRLILVTVFVFGYLFVNSPIAFAELIEPTRTQEGIQEGPGRLTVLSEPPGLKVTLDGNNLGKTPAFLIEVQPGIHTLRIKDSKTDIFIESGKLLKISLFKNKFVLIPVKEISKEEQPAEKAGIETRQPQVTKPTDPVKTRTEKSRREAVERFNRFLDGTQDHF